MAAETTTPPFRPGLEGVPATQSAVCDIDGLQGLLTYQIFSVEQLIYQLGEKDLRRAIEDVTEVKTQTSSVLALL